MSPLPCKDPCGRTSPIIHSPGKDKGELQALAQGMAFEAWLAAGWPRDTMEWLQVLPHLYEDAMVGCRLGTSHWSLGLVLNRALNRCNVANVGAGGCVGGRADFKCSHRR